MVTFMPRVKRRKVRGNNALTLASEIRSNDTGFLLPFLEEHVPPLMDDWNYSTRYFAEFNALAHRPRYHDYLRWYINGIPGLPGSINILVNLRQEFPPACSRSSLTLQPPRQ